MTAGGSPPRPRVSSKPVTPSRSPVPLSAVAEAVPHAERRGDGAVPVLDVAFDARVTAPGCVFFCVPGAHVDGHRFAAAAADAGAVGLIVERWIDDVNLPQVRVPNVREAMGPMSAVVFGSPAGAMTMVGVTGTNGKTTVTYLLESVFAAAGLRPGVIGTTGARIDGRQLPLERTTPEAPDLHRSLARMRDAGVQAVAMEASSHALDQRRVGGVRFDVAAFTNLSQDHLDFHPSMEAYFEAKSRLFSTEHARRAIVNADDAWGRRLLRDAEVPTTSYGLADDADVRAADVTVTPDGAAFTVDGIALRSGLRGAFNVENCVCAFAVARALDLAPEAIVRGIGSVRTIPGRLEPVEAGQNFLVVVDYAHTPDSILTVLQAVRPLTSGRLIVVFGCGGDRDRDKRPRMGATATANADLTILTNDNPRSESPMDILGAIEVGAKEGRGDYEILPDRRAAITHAIAMARRGDAVVIAGKGHERTQEFADTTVVFDDRLVAREAILATGRGGDPE
jgi:UDP-N-acetylmuramoyl-L-alanyl-D-glutamate--2,6-diaminopimelate ligase